MNKQELSDFIGEEFKLNVDNQFDNYEDSMFHLDNNFIDYFYEMFGQLK